MIFFEDHFIRLVSEVPVFHMFFYDFPGGTPSRPEGHRSSSQEGHLKWGPTAATNGPTAPSGIGAEKHDVCGVAMLLQFELQFKTCEKPTCFFLPGSDLL